MPETIEIGRHYLPLEVRRDTFNEEARTVEVIWSTGAAVKRYSWRDGYFMEELSMDPGHIRMQRLNDGAAFLDTHDSYSMEYRIGAVVPGTARIEKGKGICTVKFSRAANAERVFQDVKDGIPLPISVGYRVHKYEKTEGENGEIPKLRALDWEPMEISAVPIPADPGAHARSANNAEHARFEATIVRAEHHEEEATPMTTAADTDAVAAERQRARTIEALGSRAGLSPARIRKAIDNDVTVEQFRQQLLDDMLARTNRDAIMPYAEPVDHRQHDDVAVMGEALYARFNPAHELSPAARQWRGAGLLDDMARHCLERAGVGTRGLTRNKILARFMSTSDFPIILGDAVGRTLRAGYTSAPVAIKRACKQATARDFRPMSRVQLSGAPGLLKINESGEYKRGALREGGEGYGIATYGRVLAVTRQVLINDDLGAFMNMAAAFGAAASRFEADFLADLLESNPEMSDGENLFSAAHGNLAETGSALDATALTEARLALRTQRGLQGEILGIVPAILLVPPQLETTAEQLVATISATKTSDVNPFANLSLAVEPRLEDAKAWYLFANPNVPGSEVIEYAYLEGQEGVYTEERLGFDIDGVEIKARLDFGAGALDWRGAFKNPGPSE